MIANYPIEDDEPPAITIWQRINRLLWIVIVLAVVALIIGAFQPEIAKQREARRKNEDLQRSIDEQKAINTHLKNQEGWLQHDPDYLAVVARDKQNLMKPGETILVLDPAKAPALQPDSQTTSRKR